MSNLLSLTSAQLKRAADIKDKISALEKELAGILGSPVTATTAAPAPKMKSKLNAAARAKIAAAQKARWAKVKTAKPAAKAPAKPVVKKKFKISAAGRAKIAAAAKARWAKAKAAGKTKLG